MNLIKASLMLLVFIVVIAILFIAFGENSEKLIEGSWSEASWKYEKLDRNFDSNKLNIEEGIKQEIYQNIIIHEAEQWKFNSDGTLILYNKKNKNSREKLHWSIKGRGHILELTHQDGRTEDYQIELLTNDLFILYFSFDIQIRGVVKITFIRN